MLLRVILALCLMTGAAQAGPWPRGEGNTFISLSYTVDTDPNSLGTTSFATQGFGSILAERGFNERLTFGLDAGIGETGDFSAHAYVSRAMGPLDGTNRFALHAGGGYVKDNGVEQPQAFFGASWGRGLDTRWGGGWTAVDFGTFYWTDTSDVAAKVDVTAGVNFSDTLTFFVQGQAGQYPDADAYVRVVPSVVYGLSEGPRLELGLPVGLTGDTDVGIKLGTWLSF